MALMCYISESGVRQIDGEVFKEIYEENYKRVCMAVHIMAGPDAEDVVQEAFIKLYNAPPANMDNLAAWVTRVAINLAKNRIRSDSARKRRENGTLMEKAAYIDETAICHIERQAVRRALSRMKRRDAEVLVLKYSGYSYKEISQVLNIKKSSVGTIIARAQAKFKSLFEGGE